MSSPAAMVMGAAENWMICGTLPVVTVTAALQVAEGPLGP